MKLFGYWRSSATWRVRIALNLKGLAYVYEPVNLLKDEQNAGAYVRGNPQALVPTLATDSGAKLTQSLAIVEYLEDAFPEPAILPRDPVLRAKARAIAAAIACEAQPFGNLRTMRYLETELGLSDDARAAWLDRWVGGSLRAVEALAGETSGRFAVGESPTVADAFVVPQLATARRFNVDLSGCDRLLKIEETCRALDPFIRAHPDNQPDKPKG